MAANLQTSQQPAPSAVPALVRNTHIALYRLTGGVIGSRAGRIQLLLLTTTGRKSGKARITALQYLPDGDSYLLIASNGGAATHPQWYLNLLACPEASVQVGRKIIPVTARSASAEERPRLWALIIRFGYFATYARKASRELPVIILTPGA